MFWVLLMWYKFDVCPIPATWDQLLWKKRYMKYVKTDNQSLVIIFIKMKQGKLMFWVLLNMV